MKRAIRFSEPITSTSTTPIAASSDGTRIRSEVPTKNNKEKIMAPKINPVPRSRPARINPSSANAPGMKGSSNWAGSFSLRRLLWNRAAAHSTRTSFANSEGWMVSNPPIRIQLRFPLVSYPKGVWTRINPSTAAAHAGAASFRSVSGFMRLTGIIRSNPTTKKINWRIM